MQPLDPHSLFSIFEQGDEQVYKEHGVEHLLENPYVLLGMVIRGLDNHNVMDMMYMRSYPEQYKQVRDRVKLKYYNNLLGYLTRIDTNKFESIYTIGESYDVQQVVSGLNVLRTYFEDLEMYEKCAIIKKYIDLVHYAANEWEKRKNHLERIVV